MYMQQFDRHPVLCYLHVGMWSVCSDSINVTVFVVEVVT